MHPRPAVVVALLASGYVTARMPADVTGLEITETAGFVMAAGTPVQPFTLRDLVHKVAGKMGARALIVGLQRSARRWPA